MQKSKTHEAQLDIIEKRVDTSNAGPEFDMEADLRRSDAAKNALKGGDKLRTDMRDLTSDRGMIRGENQESRHRKGSGQAS